MSSLAQNLPQFLSELALRLKIVEDTRSRANSLLALEYNIFDYIEPNRRQMLRIVADLLNPQGAHSQGKTFLHLWFDALQMSHLKSGSEIRVEWEGRIASTRVDLLIQNPAFTLAVVLDSLPETNLKSCYLAGNQEARENFYLVFLTHFGSRPRTLNQLEIDSMGHRFHKMHYQHGFLNWIRSCALYCQAEKVRWFLGDFGDYVERKFPSTALEGEMC